MNQTLRQWLQQSPFTLALSSGYFSLFAHCGMVSVLEEEGLFPVSISGASAGALIGVCWAAGCSTAELREILFGLRKRDFWDPTPGFGLLKGERFRAFVARVSPAHRLEHCRIPVSISTFDPLTWSTRVWTNGPLVDCVYASCTVPLLFQPIRIEGRFCFDGGILDRAGLAGAPADARVLLHHIPVRRFVAGKSCNASLCLPKRQGMIAVSPLRLCPVDPNRLEAGRIAFRQAARSMSVALDQPLRGAHCVVPVG